MYRQKQIEDQIKFQCIGHSGGLKNQLFNPELMIILDRRLYVFKIITEFR